MRPAFNIYKVDSAIAAGTVAATAAAAAAKHQQQPHNDTVMTARRISKEHTGPG